LGKLQQRQEQAYKAEELARRRYSRGVERLLIVLETQRRRRIAENEVVAVENELWQNRVNLFLALGGDWDVPCDAIAQINNSGNNR
jgi:outer membrane protein TolC